MAAVLTDDESVPDGAGQEAEAGLPYTQIDRYRLLSKLGEGAFGEVFSAEQGQPVERRVALKLLKRGMDSAQVAARFEAERQALALMNHPNVAAVIDGGETEDGRPYFVMEFVDGETITDYCSSHDMGLRGRLDLLVSVCEGVQHAHGRGIIHRDIKPENVLVEANDDGTAVAKVIDFGIAKAAERLLTTRTLYTELGRMVGTPAYMSPEQAGGAGADVDVRTDVYSLGVLLYELLTGDTPFDSGRLRDASAAEMERILKEEQPERPSNRLETQSTTGASTLSAPITRRAIRGDLDWIVMCAMEKERKRRYASVSDFARDIKQFLAGDAIAARPPSPAYRFRKWSRRHRAFLIGTIAVMSALAIGIVTSTQQMKRAVRAEKAAEERAEISDALNSFFEDDLIAAALEDPNFSFFSLTKVLYGAEEKIDGRLTKYPVAEAGARLMLGRAFLGLNQTENARRNAQRAFTLFGNEVTSLDDKRYIGSAQCLATALIKLERPAEAREVIAEVFAKLGTEADLSHTDQAKLLATDLSAALLLGDSAAVLAIRNRLLSGSYNELASWEAIFELNVDLSEESLAAGQIDEAAKHLVKAAIIARLMTWSGTWVYRENAFTVYRLRAKLLRAGAVQDQLAHHWEKRLAEWDLAEVADSFGLPTQARAMIHAFLQREAGDPTAAAATLDSISGLVTEPDTRGLIHARAICLEMAGETQAAHDAALHAINLAHAAGDELAMTFYAATWRRLRTAGKISIDPKSLPLSESVIFPENGHRYALVAVPMSWDEADQVCQALGGHLATVGDASEDAFLTKTFAEERICWLGGTDKEQEGTWRWVTDEPWDYTNWGSNQPDVRIEIAKAQDCLLIGKFNYQAQRVKNQYFTKAGWHDITSEGILTKSLKHEIYRNLLVTFAICEWEDES